MFTKTRILLSLLFLLVFSAVEAQEQIERLFRGDRQNTGIDVVQTPDDGYLVLSAGRPLDSTRFEFYTVSKFDNKTNFVWSKDYDFEQKVFPDGSLTLLDGDSFLISGILDTTSINKILMKAGPNGDVAWTKGFGRDDLNTPLALGDAPVDVSTHGYFLAGDVYSLGFRNDIFLTETDSAGNQRWGKIYSENTTGFYSTKVKMTQDSGAIICGSALSIPNSDISVVKTDSIGNIEWSRVYGEPGIAELGTAIIPTPDGGYLIGGRKVHPVLPSHPGVLIKTDTFGTPQWVFNVTFGTSDTVLVNDLMMMNDGNVLVSGSLLGSVDNFAYMMKMSLNGDIIWKRRYKASTRQSLFSNGLDEASNGGGVYLTSSDEDPNNTQAGFYLIKTDENGQTICDSIIDQQLLFPDTIMVDTLELMSTDVSDIKDVIITDTTGYSFNLVTLELETFGPYCPDAIFSDTLDATTDGAIAYEWSTGETTPTIVVTEFDEYMVTVTVGEDFCYTLCGMSTISELPLPTIELASNDDSFCSEGTVIISATTTATDEINWSTTEMGNSITVSTEGIFTATASNTCGDEMANIDIVFDTSAPGPVTVAEVGNFCDDGMSTLEVTAPGYDGVLWSSGEGTLTILADQSGIDYFATGLSNFCDDLQSNSIQVSTPSIDGTISSNGTYCATGEEILTLVPSREPLNNIIWQNDNTQTNLNFTVTDPSVTTYSVSFSDFCDDATVEFTVERPEITGEIETDGLFCGTGEEVLSVVNTNRTPINYTWNNDNSETNPTFTVTDPSEATYSVVFSDFCDEGSDSEQVERPEMTGEIVSDGLFCSTGEEILSITNTNRTPINYTWNNDNSETNPTFTAMDLGLFTVSFSDFCPEGTAEFDIEQAQISVSISGDDTFCDDGDEVLSADPSAIPTSYAWSDGATTPSTTITARGEYFLTVTDFCGSASDSITILCGFNFDAPNAFTPNSDGVSDLFIPLFTADITDFVEYKFEVFSRWGVKVFETDDPLEGWDGTLKEKAAASDVYFFRVEGVNIFGEPLTRIDNDNTDKNHGDVTLIR